MPTVARFLQNDAIFWGYDVFGNFLAAARCLTSASLGCHDSLAVRQNLHSCPMRLQAPPNQCLSAPSLIGPWLWPGRRQRLATPASLHSSCCLQLSRCGAAVSPYNARDSTHPPPNFAIILSTNSQRNSHQNHAKRSVIDHFFVRFSCCALIFASLLKALIFFFPFELCRGFN